MSVCVYVSVPRRIPTLLHGPGYNLGEWQGYVPWANVHPVHGFRCYDNIAPNAKCQRVLVLALLRFFGSSVKAGHGLSPLTVGIGVWLDGVGQAEMYGWNVWHSRTNEWKDETSQMPGGRTNQQLCENRRSTCKDQYEKKGHKMCHHQLNGWSWKDDEKVRWK